MRLLAAALAALSLLACDPSSPAPPTVPRLKAPVGAAPVLGPADAWVTVVVFSDLECPFCAQEHPLLEQLVTLYPGDVRLVWKHFPLPASLHPYARPAAIAAECAKAQGLFWPMADLVFAHRTQLAPADLASYAAQVGLDTAAWSTCLTAGPAAAAVDADVALGTSLGVNGTPTSLVNGKAVVGAQPLSTLQAEVEAARAAAIASGIPRADYYLRAVMGQ